MADVFLIEDYEDCADENNESDQKPKMTIDVEIEDSSVPQILLNDDDSEDVAEETTNTSDIILREEDSSEPEISEAEDLLVNPDDLLPPVVKLEKYASSDIVFNRQVVARNLLETLRLVHGNPEDVARVISVLCGISEDYDPIVRQELMVQLPHITAFCKEVTLNNPFAQCLVPMLITFLGDENNNVRKSCHSTVLSLIEQGFLDADIVSEKMCPLVLHLTDPIHPEDLRIESILVMSKLVVLLGKKAAEELFIDRLFTLCTDKSNNIRKACASTFGDICTTCGRETTEEVLLPKFFALCEDTAWCVRKACAENFMPVSCVVSRETRHKELSSFYLILLADQSRWVRMTAFQALGPFISTFAEPDRTGLYYSKDGVLTIVDTPRSPAHTSSPDEKSELCNSKPDELSSDNSSSDRTSSSIPCDSVVPPCSTDSSLTAQEVPGISCHVGNYCTVIEVSPPTTTTTTVPANDPSETASDDSGKGSSTHCDSDCSTDCEEEKSHFDAAGNVKSEDLENGSMLEDCVSLSDSEDKFNKSLTKEEREFNKLWYEAVYGCDDESSWNGALENCNINGEASLENHLGALAGKSEEKSTLLNSITVNGINLSSSIALSGPINCDSIPMISCNNSLKERKLSELPHSAGDDGDAIPSLTFFSQELSDSLAGISLDEADSEESAELKVSGDSPDKECAFNHFQYWRNPLPEVEIDADRLTGASDTDFEAESEMFDSGGFGSKMRRKIKDFIIFDVRTPVDKGEPPPGTKLLSPHDQDIVPPELLLQYLNMIDAAWAQTIDAEIARHCAYSLPAVALTLGREYWPCLKETFDALSSDLQGFIMMWKVRRTIASAMHQLAVILGPDITSRDLLPVFSRFINDLDEVRVGILQHLYEFLKVLRQEERNQFLPNLEEFLVSNSDSDSNEKNWRFRLILAEQLVSIVDLYEPRYIRIHLVPLTLTLIKDKVCEVRLATVRVMAAVMKQLSQSPAYAKAFISELTENFVHSPKWLYRQLYVYICQQVILEKSLSPNHFAEEALPQLLYLCWDRVPNVRIAIARCLVIVIWPIDVFSNPESPHRELLLQTIHTLQSDIDADVRFYANMVSTHECSCLQNGGFTNVEIAIEPIIERCRRSVLKVSNIK